MEAIGDAFAGQGLQLVAVGVGAEIDFSAQALVEAAHQTCPYSKISRGNIDVTITLARAHKIDQPRGRSYPAERPPPRQTEYA